MASKDATGIKALKVNTCFHTFWFFSPFIQETHFAQWITIIIFCPVWLGETACHPTPHPKKVQKIQPFASNILWMRDYKNYISQNAGLSSTEPVMLASVWLPFCMWKNALNLQVKGITNASWITLVNQHQLCSMVHEKMTVIVNLFEMRHKNKTILKQKFLFCSYWGNIRN